MFHINIKYIILSAFVAISVGYGQDPKDTISILHRDLNKIVKIDFHKVFQFDSQNLLDKDFVPIADSAEVYNFNNEFWFRWKLAISEWNEDRSVELFSFNPNTNKIFQITNHNLYWSNGYSGMVEEVYYFDGRMFVIGKSKNEDPEGHNVVLVIDPVVHSVAKEIHFNKSSYTREISTKDKMLFVNVQCVERNRNILYYLLFGAGGKQSKWHYTEIGNQWKYTLDSSFTIQRQEEIKK